MRDLYALLQINSQSTQAEVIAALNGSRTLSEADRQAVESVLLNPNRRRQYDRVRHTVHQIAVLRSTLGMELGTQFQQGIYSDFSPRPPRASAADIPQRSRPSTAGATGGNPRARPNVRAQGGKNFWVVVVVLMGIFWGLLYLTDQDGFRADQPLQKPGQVATASAPKKPVFNQPIQPLPATGAFDMSGSTTQNAIIVRTRGDRHTLVKIERLFGGEVTRGFIRAGGSHTFHLPVGTYILKTAGGSTWYGEQHLFGPDTVYSKADDTFPLVTRGERWTVELIPQQAGNLREVPLRPEQF